MFWDGRKEWSCPSNGPGVRSSPSTRGRHSLRLPLVQRQGLFQTGSLVLAGTAGFPVAPMHEAAHFFSPSQSVSLEVKNLSTNHRSGHAYPETTNQSGQSRAQINSPFQNWKRKPLLLLLLGGSRIRHTNKQTETILNSQTRQANRQIHCVSDVVWVSDSEILLVPEISCSVVIEYLLMRIREKEKRILSAALNI